MSMSFSKNKEKRSRSSSSEANNSFVKNVTSRVSGLLPATITKWFSSPSSSATNGSAQTADATDSSTEDEAPESPIVTQPPSKRMRYSSPGGYNHYSATETNCITSNVTVTELEPAAYGSVQSPPGRTTFRRETNYVSTPLRSPTEESIIDRTEKDSSSFKAHTMSTAGPSVATKRKSLFDSSPSRIEASIRACAKTASNQMKDPKAPCFKPSLLGSPFYPGRTMYGGASSCYINQPNIKQRKSTVVNESNTSDNSVSHSTRRIMDLLEHYSSPLNEAKRIPPYSRPKNDNFNITLESYPPTKKVISYKTQELHVPNIAKILRITQKSRLMDTTNAARQILASHSSTSHLPYPTISQPEKEQTVQEPSNPLTTKVKSRLTRPKRGESLTAETELPAPVNLPNAVLQIDQNNLPKFSLETTSSASPLITSTPIVPVASARSSTQFFPTAAKISEPKPSTQFTEKPTRKPDSVPSSDQYNFSSPVRISSEQLQTEGTPPKFKFGSPERSIDTIKVSKNDDVSSVVGSSKEPENKVTAPKSKDWQCPDCWVNNKPDVDKCVCCGYKNVSSDSKNPSKCSLCKLADSKPNTGKCANCEKIQVNNVNSNCTITKPPETSKWKCEDCWVNNDESAEKCLCCGGSNPKKAAAKPAAVSNDTDGEWKCDDCWVKNKSSADQCAACGGARPGARKDSQPPAPATGFFNTPIKSNDNAFKDMAKKQTQKWECPNCLVRNECTKMKCVCCETDKPGTISEASEKAFNFGKNTSFKFGIPKEQNTPKPTEVNATVETKKAEESETNNNVLSKTPTFTFGLPAKKPEDQTDSAKKTEEKVDSAPKVNFSFGVPSSTPSTTAVTSSIFGMPSKPAEPKPKTVEEDSEKPQEVPTVEFSIPKTQEAPKVMPNLFASSLASLQATPAPVSFSASVAQEKPLSALNSIAEVKKDAPANPLSLPAATSAAAPPQPAPTFTFGGGIKSSNLFTAPTTAATTTATITFGSLQSTPTNSTSLFQKSETATTTASMSLFAKSETLSTPSLFQKADAPATVTTAAPAAPLFSFGTGNATTQPEKPKFNFTFGSSEVKFGMTPGNSIGSGNTTLGGNGLSTGSTLGGNVLSTGGALGGSGLPALGGLGGNGLSVTPLGGRTEMSNNPLTGNGLQSSSTLQSPAGGLFGAAVQKENTWTANNNNTSNNLFGASSSNSNLQKPAFTFGSATPFNANTSAPAFGSTAQSTPSVFGMANQNSNNQGGLFSSSQPAGGSLFGSSQPAATPAMSLFGSPSMGAAPAFGSPSPALPAFEAPAPAPAFNFGGAQQSPVFGFGQQQAQPQQQAGVYSFGGAAGGPQMQFNMGSTPGPAVRRVRKAVRRTTPR